MASRINLRRNYVASINASVVDFDDASVIMPKPIRETNKRLTDYVANVILILLFQRINLGAEDHHGKRETFDNKEADIRDQPLCQL